jgi:hypothetical protein
MNYTFHVELIPQDINNFRYKLKKSFISKTVISSLIDKFIKCNWKFSIKEKNDDILAFLFIPSSSFLLIQMFSHVLLIDTTYNTNTNGYPLITGVGISNVWKSFSVFYCFITDETEEMYSWCLSEVKKLCNGFLQPKVISTDKQIALLNAIKREFPYASSLLCLCFLLIKF